MAPLRCLVVFAVAALAAWPDELYEKLAVSLGIRE